MWFGIFLIGLITGLSVPMIAFYLATADDNEDE